MPVEYGCSVLPYTTKSRLANLESDRVARLIVWDNQAGVTIGHSLNIGLEGTGNARTLWAPAGNYTSNGGTHVTGQAGANAPNNAVDTIRGGPGLRREHIFSVPVRGYDRMYVEFRGKVVSATGFGLVAAAPSTVSRAYFFSDGYGWGTGVFSEDDSVDYMREPSNVCYSLVQAGKNASPMSGDISAGPIDRVVEPVQIIGGMPLICRGFGHSRWGTGSEGNLVRAFFANANHARVPFHGHSSGDKISTAGMLWGYREKSGGVDVSRYPTAEDELTRQMAIGYSIADSVFVTSSLSDPKIAASDLRITGLSRIWFAMWEVFPPTGLTNELLSTGSGIISYLDWTTGNATMTIAGRITVTLVRDGR